MERVDQQNLTPPRHTRRAETRGTPGTLAPHGYLTPDAHVASVAPTAPTPPPAPTSSRGAVRPRRAHSSSNPQCADSSTSPSRKRAGATVTLCRRDTARILMWRRVIARLAVPEAVVRRLLVAAAAVGGGAARGGESGVDAGRVVHEEGRVAADLERRVELVVVVDGTLSCCERRSLCDTSSLLASS